MTKHRMKKQWLAVIASIVFFSNLTQAKDIITSLPVTYMLATQLTKGSEIQTDYLPPKRYGIERIENWYASKGTQHAKAAAKNATVAITLGAIWPQDPTYIYARQGNIHVIEVDASQAISPHAQSVAALTLNDGSISKYVWLNPTNLIRMIGITSEDLQRIFPSDAHIIRNNQQRLLLNIRDLIDQQQNEIFKRNIDSVVLFSQSLEDFASGMQLFVSDRQFKPEFEWSKEDEARLKTLFSQDKTLWVMTTRKPSKQLLTLIPEDRILVVDPIDRWGSEGIDHDNPLKRWIFK